MRWFQQQTRYDNFPKCVTLHCYTCVIIIIQSCNKILSPILFYLFIIIINYFKKVLKRLGNYLLLILCLPIDFKIPLSLSTDQLYTSPHGPNKAFHIVNQHNNLLCAMMSSILVTEKGFWQPRIPLEIPNLIEAVPLPTKSWINFGNLRRIRFPKKHKMSIKTRISSC